ncbi:MAG TPA: hypothetical protein VFQ43_19470 [Nitrososphaera sp.]|nr:hypothetical protein [Nitrososphaera sp.]
MNRALFALLAFVVASASATAPEVLCFAYPLGRPRDGLAYMARGTVQMRDDFPFLMTTIVIMRSFVPTKWPTPDELQEMREAWSRGLAHVTGAHK